MTQADTTLEPEIKRDYWLRGAIGQVATGLCGVIAVLVALKSVAFEPGLQDPSGFYDHFVRILSFAALTVWIALTIGIRRRNAAAMIALAFAIVVELILVPTQHTGLSTITAANLGIVLAYCGLELYWKAVADSNGTQRLRANPSNP
ncbi:MAG: hypothetical protein AAFP81_07490 [Pseudomonadota bacterium]